jgi:dihydroorotate dehydrogenase
MNNFWKFIPAELAHSLAPIGLKIYSSFYSEPTPNWHSVNWRGLHFQNPLGIAGGVDKNADNVLDWQNLGAGFIEIGTVTPKAQDQNPGAILARDWEEKNLWNKMGFPNAGGQEVFANLDSIFTELKIPIFVNIGKNRNTLKTEALSDYQSLAAQFSEMASAIVLNVSSPNTKDLRDLQAKDELKLLVQGVASKLKSCQKQPPIIVKLSPDLSTDLLKESIETAINNGASGINLTNTTLGRPQNSFFPKEGGLSGSFLRELSLSRLEICQNLLGKSHDYLIISTGGIFSAKDIQERLALGAKLVQVYSALVFEGPRFLQNIGETFIHSEGKILQ